MSALLRLIYVDRVIEFDAAALSPTAPGVAIAPGFHRIELREPGKDEIALAISLSKSKATFGVDGAPMLRVEAELDYPAEARLEMPLFLDLRRQDFAADPVLRLRIWTERIGLKPAAFEPLPTLATLAGHYGNPRLPGSQRPSDKNPPFPRNVSSADGGSNWRATLVIQALARGASRPNGHVLGVAVTRVRGDGSLDGAQFRVAKTVVGERSTADSAKGWVEWLPSDSVLEPAVAGPRPVPYWILRIEGFGTDLLADVANRLGASYRDALTTVLADRDVSFVPMLSAPAAGAGLTALRLCTDRRDADAPFHGVEWRPATGAKLSASLQHIVMRDGTKAPVAILSPGVRSGADRRLAVEAPVLELDATIVALDPSASVARFGALDLMLGGAGTGSLHLEFRSDGKDVLRTTAMALAIDGLPLSDVAPGGEDALSRDDGAVEGLVVVTDAVLHPAQLRVRESCAPGTSRQLALNVSRPAVAAATPTKSLRLAYLSRHPFFVGFYELAPLSAIGEDFDQIALFRSDDTDGARWQIASAQNGFELLLPPQVVGETMHRYRSDSGGIRDGEPIDYRFGTEGRLTLRSNFFRTRFVEAPWNFHRVLGFPGQRAPGARLDRASFELVYGLETTIDGERVPFRLHVAELGARLGALAAPVDALAAEGKGYPVHDPRRAIVDGYRKRFDRLRTLYSSRLAVLEPYDLGERMDWSGAAGTAATGSLNLDEGIECTLRKDADLRNPIDPARRLRPESPYFSDKPGSFLGSYAQAFESQNALDALCRDRRSNHAQVSGLFFSALGGWGHQRATFDNRRASIVSTTGMGRVHRLVVERVGRIAVLWHRARHVIVYDRTTAAAPQFAGEQLALEGRPVLRKVEEYVEILEPLRRYPESGDSPLARGCVESAQFASLRIPVTSRWSRDLASGYEIPLWKRDADPWLYPKPRIAVISAGDRQGVADSVRSLIAAPERLYFYSNTEPQHDDRTDLWPPVPEIDYSTRPALVPEPDAPLDPGRPDDDLPNSPVDVPGWERFTFPVDPPAAASNVVAGRTAASVNARLDAFTLSRGRPSLESPAPEAALLRTSDRLRAAVEPVRRLLADLPTPLDDAARSRLQREQRRVESMAANLAADARQAATTLRTLAGGLAAEWPKQALGALQRDLQHRLGDGVRTQRRQWQDWLAASRDRFDPGRSLDRDAAAGLLELAAAELGLAVRPPASGLESVGQAIGEVKDALDVLYRDLLARYDDLAANLAYGGLNKDQARAALDALFAELDAALARMRAALPTGLPPLAQSAVDRVRTQLQTVLGTDPLSVWRKAIAKAIDAQPGYVLPPLGELDGLRDALFGELDELVGTQGLALVVAAARRLAGEVQARVDELINDVRNLVTDAQRRLREALPTLPQPVPGAELLRWLTEAVDRAAGTIAAYEQKLATLAEDTAKRLAGGVLAWPANPLQHLDHVFDDLPALSAAVAQALQGGVDAARKKLDEVLDGLGQAYDRTQALLADFDRSPTFQDPRGTLNLLRAVGEGPVLPGLRFNRERLAYFFDDAALAVRTSPVAALANRLGDDLKALGLRVPTRSLLDGVIPDALQNFDVNKVFADIAGLRLDGLFGGLKLPAIANDRIEIKHGIDKGNQSAWLKARANVPLAGRSRVFELGPLGLYLNRAGFYAKVDVVAGLGSALRQTSEAELSGDWELSFGGLTVVAFVETAVRFTQAGDLDFRIDPRKIRMDSALQWLAALLKTVQGDRGLPPVELVERDGKVVGVRMVIATPLPALSAGAFAIAGVALGAALELTVDPDDSAFAIEVRFNLSEQTKPFTLNIGYLNGGGWLRSRARYVPARGDLVSEVSIGIAAGVGLEFAFGPVAGSGYIQFGIFVEFRSSRRGGSQLSIGVMLLIRGEALVCGIVWVGLTLLLQAVYRSDGTLTGYGTISLTIRISRFFKIRVQRQATYPIRGRGGGKSAALEAAAPAAALSPVSAALLRADRRAELVG